MKFTRQLLTFSTALVLFGTTGLAATIQLLGISSATDTALVSNETLLGSTYSFTIQNTAPVGIIANLGLSFGNILRLSSFTTSAPFQYNIQNNTIAPDFNFPLDFAMAGADQTKGLAPGETETYTWTLTMANGSPVSGISAEDIAEHQVVRFRLLPTAGGTDLAVGSSVVPEPATSAIMTLAVCGIAVRLLSPLNLLMRAWKFHMVAKRQLFGIV